MPTPTITPVQARLHRKPKWVAFGDGPTTAPTLVAATYAPSFSVTLTFDRAIDVSGLVGSAVVVDDGEDARLIYHARVATLVSPNVVTLTLADFGDSVGERVTMTVSAGNGIFAAADGVAWAGVSDLALPFA